MKYTHMSVETMSEWVSEVIAEVALDNNIIDIEDDLPKITITLENGQTFLCTVSEV